MPPEKTQDGTPATINTTSVKSDPVNTPKLKASSKTTIKLTDILKADAKKDSIETVDTKPAANEPFTEELLRRTWMEFSELRKIYQAEYQLLSQPYLLQENRIVVRLMHPVQETMLNNMKSELTTFLREKLKNNSIVVVGEISITDDKKIIYTNREKFDHLANLNPALLELRDRLGLDTDF